MDPAFIAPFLVSWNVTKRCNLRCAHCYLDSTELAGRGEDFVGVVKRLSFVSNVRTGNGKILVDLDDPELRNPGIIDALTKAGAKIEYVSELKRSLEDVYMKLIGGGPR